MDPEWIVNNPNKRPRRSRERLFGTVIRAINEKTWLVQFDNGIVRECSTNTQFQWKVKMPLSLFHMIPAIMLHLGKHKASNHLANTGNMNGITACFTKTGVMIAMETQRGKVGMANLPYAQHGGTTACCLRLLDQFVLPASRECFKGDAWFGSVKAVVEAGIKGHLAVTQVKTNKALFPKEFIESTLKDMPGGVQIVLEGKHPNGTPLIAMGYRYSKKTTLFFVLHKDAGSTELGVPYEMKYTDDHGNVCVRLIDRPDVISKFFVDSNLIDAHNQVRQCELALEKQWVTNCGYFCVATTLVRINVVDCWKLAQYHKVMRQDEMSIVKFAGLSGNS